MVSFRPRPPPISRDEFARMFKACMPPTGWSPNIAVANSGGPDSTCLLFLLHRHLSALKKKGNENPQQIHSFTIDHDLQPGSASMASHTVAVARKFGLPSRRRRIPWSVHPYPPRPEQGKPIEGIARDVRYHALFHLMLQENVKTIAFAHHADDQLETTLMRLGRGSTLLGAKGIWPCRRWGMGILKKKSSTFRWAGWEGMDRWIVRPLLPVGKDRILATCDEHGLEYVTDPTNFQPGLTVRNALRHRMGLQSVDAFAEMSENLSPEIQAQLENINEALQALSPIPVTLDSGKEQIQGAIQTLVADSVDIDNRVDILLTRCRIPSPEGTFLLSQRSLSNIAEPLHRRAIILRILRYVSPFAWGSLRAEANRRRQSLEQIIEKLWDLPASCQRFVAGGGVVWTPVMYNPAGEIRRADRPTEEKDSAGSFGWIASRQPPFDKRNSDHGPLGEIAYDINLTGSIVGLLKKRLDGQSSSETWRFLWDNRFLVTINPEKMPQHIQDDLLENKEAYIKITPHSAWHLPLVTYTTRNKIYLLHSPDNRQKVPLKEIMKLLPDSDGLGIQEMGDTDAATPKWIKVEFIRPLDVV